MKSSEAVSACDIPRSRSTPTAYYRLLYNSDTWGLGRWAVVLMMLAATDAEVAGTAATAVPAEAVPASPLMQQGHGPHCVHSDV